MSKRARYQPYSRSNPPPTYDAALVRLEDLRQNRPRIERDLEFTREDDYASVADYLDWKQAATRSLGYKDQEYAYLIDYFVVCDADESRFEELTLEGKYEFLVEQCKNEEKVVRDMLGLATVSSKSSTGDIQERLALLRQLRPRMEKFFAQLRSQWSIAGLNHLGMPKVRAPLDRLFPRIAQEIARIQAMLTSAHREEHQTKQFLVGLIRDALDRGLRLSDEDERRFREICPIQEAA